MHTDTATAAIKIKSSFVVLTHLLCQPFAYFGRCKSANSELLCHTLSGPFVRLVLTKVLLVDDIPALRQHSRAVVVKQCGDGVELFEAASGKEGIERALQICPDLIILDIAMPDISGVKAAETIWKTRPEQKIIFWSQFHKESYVRAISKILPDQAIHGYVLKSELEDNLAYAIETVLTHENSYIDPIVRNVNRKLSSKDDSLTDVEYETLLDLAIGLTDRAIATRRHISVRGVQKRISALLERLLKGETHFMKESAGVELLNPRTRVVCAALLRGLLVPEDLQTPNNEMLEWIEKEFQPAGLDL